MSRSLSLGRKDADTLLLSGMDEFLFALLLEIPTAGVPPASAGERFFPPLTWGRDAAADQEWREYVRPGLEEEFAARRSTVAGDLARAGGGGGDRRVEIPVLHAPAWIHALNQARISLAAANGFGEAELDADPPLDGSGLILFQMQFYGLLQEWLLDCTESL